MFDLELWIKAHKWFRLYEKQAILNQMRFSFCKVERSNDFIMNALIAHDDWDGEKVLEKKTKFVNVMKPKLMQNLEILFTCLSHISGEFGVLEKKRSSKTKFKMHILIFSLKKSKKEVTRDFLQG